MKTGEVPKPTPFPHEQLRDYARCLVSAAEDMTGVYDAYRAQCDAAILSAAPAMPQVKFARVLGLSRTTLRTMLRRLGMARADGRKAVPS